MPWRVEVRGSLFHRDRLLSARPFWIRGNPREGWPVLSWHRSLDLAAKEGRIASLRGASTQLAFVHPSNDLKREVADWMLLMDLVEKHPVYPGSDRKCRLSRRATSVGSNQPGRAIHIYRNRSERAIKPALASVPGVDDPWTKHGVGLGCRDRRRWFLCVIAGITAHGNCTWKDRITLIQPRERRGQLANMTLAIRHVCTNPESVIVTLRV